MHASRVREKLVTAAAAAPAPPPPSHGDDDDDERHAALSKRYRFEYSPVHVSTDHHR